VTMPMARVSLQVAVEGTPLDLPPATPLPEMHHQIWPMDPGRSIHIEQLPSWQDEL
jgi:hypothetical protein